MSDWEKSTSYSYGVAKQRRPATEAEAKALASAVRLRILRLCLDRPLTNKEIADRLGAHPATVLHHVRTLVDTGFLAAQEPRRGARGSREIPYLATRKSWQLSLADSGEEPLRALIDAFVQEFRLVEDPRRVVTTRLGLRLDREAYEELRGRATALFEEYANRPPDPHGQPYSLFFALHPDPGRD